ncbi:MAG: tetratricopeptide repeat protein [Treponemataceae bacterium]|nr:MAG: tetratricopeptide repeat protein [Treponemataceae bacterium]
MQEKPDALKLYNAGKYTEAITVCEAELADNPANMDSYAVLCWALLENRRFAEAEIRSSQALALSAYDTRFLETFAEAKYQQGKLAEALPLFQEYIGSVPYSLISRSRVHRAYYYMGEIYTRYAWYQHADIAFSTACRIMPNIDMWWVRLGSVREIQKQFSFALEAYTKALEINPLSVDARHGRDRVLTQLR